MAVVIRLQRVGKPHHPHFRVVAIEQRRGPRGKALEILGHYHPKADKLKDKLVLDQDRFQYWVSKGAKPSETVGVLAGKLKKQTTTTQS